MSVSTAIRVISLTTSTDRRANFSALATHADIKWSFFDAHTGLSEPLIYDERTAKRRCCRILSQAEIGCYVSHFKCWEWFVNSEYDQIIIFEDDAMIDWRVIKKLSAWNMAEHGIDFLRLFTAVPADWEVVMPRFLSRHSNLMRTINNAYGTVGYILTKKAARLLVTNYANIWAPVDLILTRYWEHKLINYCLFPFPIIECFVPSTIGSHRENIATHRTLYDRIAGRLWRESDKFVRLYFEHFRVKKSPLGSVYDSGMPFIRDN